MTQRIDEARRIARVSLVEAAAAWEQAIASISDRAQCPLYQGLSIVPQVGLVPIGRDPASGLWEFTHVPSGDVVQRASDGNLVLEEGCGIVLVLVPGGSFSMGSQAQVPGSPPGPRTDPWAQAWETPIVHVEIEPFFAARFETTRAQWHRLTGAGMHDDPLEPQASVSWTEADRALRRAGLELPTEAQWEYVARAGTTTRYWCGTEPGSLRGVANGRRAVDLRESGEETGRAVRIDALKPNSWGLVHVHGNVAEWTRDVFAPYTDPVRAGDGARNVAENGLRSVRGGSFGSAPAQLRSAVREPVALDNHDPHIGVRAARAIDASGG